MRPKLEAGETLRNGDSFIEAINCEEEISANGFLRFDEWAVGHNAAGLAGHEPLPRLFRAYGDGRDEPDAGDGGEGGGDESPSAERGDE